VRENETFHADGGIPPLARAMGAHFFNDDRGRCRLETPPSLFCDVFLDVPGRGDDFIVADFVVSTPVPADPFLNLCAESVNVQSCCGRTDVIYRAFERVREIGTPPFVHNFLFH
jgi:hypothetical protein